MTDNEQWHHNSHWLSLLQGAAPLSGILLKAIWTQISMNWSMISEISFKFVKYLYAQPRDYGSNGLSHAHFNLCICHLVPSQLIVNTQKWFIRSLHKMWWIPYACVVNYAKKMWVMHIKNFVLWPVQTKISQTKFSSQVYLFAFYILFVEHKHPIKPSNGQSVAWDPLLKVKYLFQNLIYTGWHICPIL